jgi:predicted XRE-type DNA-binding protein
MPRLSEPTDEELEIRERLRREVLAEIERRKFTSTQLATRLELLPSGVAVLLDRGSWPLDVAVRVAGAIDLMVDLTTTPKKRGEHPVHRNGTKR